LKRSERNARWIERHLRIPDGKFTSSQFKVTAEQRKWLEMIYDSPTRTFILSMGRKNGKTAFASALVLLHLAGPEAVANGQLFSSAESRDQAALVFRYAASMVRMSVDLAKYVTIRDTAKQLHCPQLGTLYRALSAEAPTAFGLSPAFVVHDELGQVRGPRSPLYEALETAGAAQEHPLSVVISTQSPNDADLLSGLIDDAKSGKDARTKVALYTAPLRDDPFSDATIRKANPHFDVFMNKDVVRQQAQAAMRLPARESSYRNLILNQRVESFSPFIAPAIWIENGAPPTFDRKKKLYGGLDLSAVNDLCALVWVTEDGDVYPTFWLPGEGLVEKARSDRVPYDVWARDGLLLTTPGRSVEYEYVANYLKTFFRENTVQALAFDRWNMRFLRPWLDKAGFTAGELERFKEFGQGFVSMSPALRAVEERLLAKRYRHGNHPVLTMCASNAVVVTDPAGNRKLDKSKARGRIDGLVALAMAQGVIPDKPPPQYRMMIL
jgi:phage terminase large subunit-like protein